MSLWTFLSESRKPEAQSFLLTLRFEIIDLQKKPHLSRTSLRYLISRMAQRNSNVGSACFCGPIVRKHVAAGC